MLHKSHYQYYAALTCLSQEKMKIPVHQTTSVIINKVNLFFKKMKYSL